MGVEVRSLWDVEAEESFPPVRDMTVGPVSNADVAEFCRRYHYAHGQGTTAGWRYGLWNGCVLLGVVFYNNFSRTAAASLFGDEHAEKVWHMGRLALPDVVPRNSESRLIGGSLALIRREYPHVWAVLTFADTTAGHIGYVYQATNALYTGTGGESRQYVTPDGILCSGRPAKGRWSRADVARMGWTEYRAVAKHRYVYILGSRTERKARRALLRYDVLPYPKAV